MEGCQIEVEACQAEGKVLKLMDLPEEWECVECEDSWIGKLVMFRVPKVEAERLHRSRLSNKPSFVGEKERQKKKMEL